MPQAADTIRAVVILLRHLPLKLPIRSLADSASVVPDIAIEGRAELAAQHGCSLLLGSRGTTYFILLESLHRVAQLRLGVGQVLRVADL